MKRSLILTIVVSAFVATASLAATPVPAPVMPSDLETSAWIKIEVDSCKKTDGTVIARSFYEKRDGTRKLTRITKNGDIVVIFDNDVVSVREANGSWLRYDRTMEADDKQGFRAINDTLGMSPDEYLDCAE